MIAMCLFNKCVLFYEFLEVKTNKREFIKVILSHNKGLKHGFG